MVVQSYDSLNSFVSQCAIPSIIGGVRKDVCLEGCRMTMKLVLGRIKERGYANCITNDAGGGGRLVLLLKINGQEAVKQGLGTRQQ